MGSVTFIQVMLMSYTVLLISMSAADSKHELYMTLLSSIAFKKCWPTQQRKPNQTQQNSDHEINVQFRFLAQSKNLLHRTIKYTEC